MNNKDIENLNEAYDLIHETPVTKPMFPGAHRPTTSNISGVRVAPKAETRAGTDANKWIKMFKDDGFIDFNNPLSLGMEEVMTREIIGSITDLFPARVSEVAGRNKPGIKIRFNDGSKGLAFGVNRRSSVSKVLAATYHSYQDTYEKIVDEILGRAGYNK